MAGQYADKEAVWFPLFSALFFFFSYLMQPLQSKRDPVPNLTAYLRTEFYLLPFLQLHTADIGGQGTTSEVVQSIMRIIQSNGQLTAEL